MDDVQRVREEYGWEGREQVAISLHPGDGQFGASLLLNHLYVDIEVSCELMLNSYFSVTCKFSPICRAEEYKFPRTTIQIRLLRNFFLELTIVSALLVFWIRQNSDVDCWETTIGQEVYRILITDFFFHTIGTCCYYFLRYMIHKWVCTHKVFPRCIVAMNDSFLFDSFQMQTWRLRFARIRYNTLESRPCVQSIDSLGRASLLTFPLGAVGGKVRSDVLHHEVHPPEML